MEQADDGQREGGARLEGQGAAEPQAEEGRPRQGELGEERREAHQRRVRREEPEERLASGVAARGLGLQCEVEDRVDQGQYENQEPQVAQVGSAAKHAQAGSKCVLGILLGRRRRGGSLREPAQQDDTGEGGDGERAQGHSHCEDPGHEPGQPAAGHAPEGGPKADLPHGPPCRVRVEALVHHGPEAGQEHRAEHRDQQVERGGHRPRPGRAQESGGERAGREGHREARPQAPGRGPALHEPGEAEGRGRGERRRGDHHDGQGRNLERREEERVAGRLARDLLGHQGGADGGRRRDRGAIAGGRSGFESRAQRCG